MSCSDKNKTTDMEGSNSTSSCVIPRCKAGQHVTTGKTCGYCLVDSYQPINEPNSSVNCTPCPDSTGTKYMGSTDQMDCIPFCPEGQQFDNSTKKCVNCSMGYYKPKEHRFDACFQCRENYTTNGDGQTSNISCSIRDCPKGTNIRGENCDPCPYAMYQDYPLQNSCIPCGPNLNTSNTGAVSKNDCTIWCGPGQEGSTNCTLCSEDKFKSTAGYGQCVSCDPDKDYTASMNRTVCDVLYCRKGYYRNNTSCVPCAAETYKPVRGNTECMKCPAGNTSMDGGIDCPVLHCVPGKTLDMKIQMCVECPKGTWKSKAGNMSCTPCDPNRTTASIGANSSDMCDTEVCGAGQYRNSSNKTGCENCPLNTYQDGIGQIDCIPCGGHNITLSAGSNASTDCVSLCVAGEQYNDSTRKCDKCPRGFYKATDGNIQNRKCVPCPSGKTTVTTGSSSLEDCKLAICHPGSYRPEGNTSCSVCPIGQYQPESDQTYCLSCPTNYTTSEPNSTLSISCIPDCRTVGGVYYKNGVCLPCPIGQYREPDPFFNMPDGCILCGSGKSTAQTGRKSRLDCLSEPKDLIRPVLETVSFSFSMTFISNTRCIDSNRGLIRIQIEIVIFNQMKKKGLCKNDCVNIVVAISASSCGANRRKRETNDAVIADVAVKNVSAVLNETDGNEMSQRTAESVLIQALQDRAVYRVQGESLVMYLNTTTNPEMTIICSAGQNLTANGCVSCPAGTKGESAGSCTECETGTYQNLTGQTMCIVCIEPRSFTEQSRSISVSQCKTLCDIQQAYCNNRGQCTPVGRSAICNCKSDYTGSRCETRAEPKSNQDAILGGAIGGGVGVLTLILFVVGCYICLTRGVKKGKSDKHSVVSQGDFGETEVFRNPIYDNGPSGIGSYPARPYPGYAYPEIEYNPYHQQSEEQISSYQKRPSIKYEEDNDQFVWRLSS
ncbi:hypothetical protein CHS0354_005697 [Potamilus streckersoni]|uniref:EGF-like domain-containing protein n=1 Tax=Potamilus streckersoni TaxID=2493646 RepID=A0AAE0S490_9BIVA|nr:hypothetical protein CHS0354_005697 [Potamilus streckersoni]